MGSAPPHHARPVGQPEPDDHLILSGVSRRLPATVSFVESSGGRGVSGHITVSGIAAPPSRSSGGVFRRRPVYACSEGSSSPNRGGPPSSTRMSL
jgi:hypothetical protein